LSWGLYIHSEHVPSFCLYICWFVQFIELVLSACIRTDVCLHTLFTNNKTTLYDRNTTIERTRTHSSYFGSCKLVSPKTLLLEVLVYAHTLLDPFEHFQLSGNTRDYHSSERSRVTSCPQEPHIDLLHIRNRLYTLFRHIICIHFIGMYTLFKYT